MKKLISLFTLLLTFFIFSGFSYQGPDFSTKNKRVVVNETKPIEGPLFKAGETISVKGEINGDVFLFGGEIFVDAVINGDLIIVGGKINIKGQVRDDLRIIGGQINLDASIGDDATIAGGEIETSSTTHISNTLNSASSYLNLSGQVDQSVNLYADRVILDGKLSQAKIFAKSIDVGDNTKVSGNLDLTYSQEPIISNSAVILGDLTTQKTDKFDQQQDFRHLRIKKDLLLDNFIKVVAFKKIISLLFQIAFGSLLIYLLPKLTQRILRKAHLQTSKSILWGFLVAFLIPSLILTLFITLIGIPLAILIAVLFSTTLYLAKLTAGLFIGQKLFKNSKSKKPYQSFIVGIFILELIHLIPLIGWLTYAVFVFLGLGAITLIEKQSLKTQQE